MSAPAKASGLDSRRSALLLAAVAVTATVVGGLATSLASNASTSWQVSVRNQLAQAEAIRNGLEDIYARELPEATEVLAARARAAGLAGAASTLAEPDRSVVLAQADAAAAGATQLASGAAPLGNDARYLRPSGIDIARRLGDLRATQGAGPPDPAAAQATGDRQSLEGVRLVAATIPVGVAFLLGALAQAYPAGRRWLMRSGAGMLAVAVVAAIAVVLLT